MKNQLQVFENAEFGKIRTLEIDGVTWFVGKDVALALGYERGAKAVQDHVEVEDKDAVPIQDSIGRQQKTPIINESGLYSLILSSKLPAAKKFKRWITTDVIPSIRKHGAYITDDVLDEALDDEDFAFDLLRKLQAERDKTNLLETVLGELAAELLPKAAYYDIVLQSKNTVPVSLIAKDYGMSASSFNRLLHDLGIQYKLGDTWLLYQTHAGKGYTKTRTYFINETTSNQHTYWTQAGRLFLYETLKEYGILPMLESGNLALQ